MAPDDRNRAPSDPAAKQVSDEAPGDRSHSDRIARLSFCKFRARQMTAHVHDLQEEARSPAEREYLARLLCTLGNCSNYLVFNHYYTIDQVKLAKMISCKKHLLCPLCARLRALKMIARYLEKYEQIQKANPWGHKLLFITLTVKNGDDLEERFQHLKASFQKLQYRRKNALNKGKSDTEFRKITGAVYSYETTNQGNGWHPHLHLVCTASDWIDQGALSAEWEQITRDSKIVDVRLIRGSPIEGFAEVFKYALKFSTLTLDDNWHAYQVLQKKRLQGAFGTFFGVPEPDDLADDLPLEDLPYHELVYRYLAGQGYKLDENHRS